MNINEYKTKYENTTDEDREEEFYKDFPVGSCEFEHYKIEIPFKSAKLDDIVYISESAYTDVETEVPDVYTKQDILDECNGCEELAEYVYDSLDWQQPSTYIEELLSEYADFVINYHEEDIHNNIIYETLWNMLNENEQENVLKACKRVRQDIKES